MGDRGLVFRALRHAVMQPDARQPGIHQEAS
jgi:hypothetical protein